MSIDQIRNQIKEHENQLSLMIAQSEIDIYAYIREYNKTKKIIESELKKFDLSKQTIIRHIIGCFGNQTNDASSVCMENLNWYCNMYALIKNIYYVTPDDILVDIGAQHIQKMREDFSQKRFDLEHKITEFKKIEKKSKHNKRYEKIHMMLG